MQLEGRRVTVMGLGRHAGGVAAARFVARAGAEVTVTDLATAESLADSLAELADVPIHRYRLGEHHEADFSQADLIVVNPAVRRHHPFVQHARRSGSQITSEMEMFLRACPAQVVGVTGSNGKSTTAAMLAAILRADGRRTWLGGNIGRSLLPELPTLSSEDWVVLELSSFQLAWLDESTPLPEVAVVTNFTPNHLDWHPDLDDYRRAKQRLLQRDEGLVVLNEQDHELDAWGAAVRGKLVPNVDPQKIPPLRVPGGHNRANAACAASAARAVGGSWTAIEQALRDYEGLPHRLQWVGDLDGRTFYNDSMATTPESVIAALRAIDRPTWLLAGGKDKGADYRPLAAAVARHARGACFYGETGEQLFALAMSTARDAGRLVELQRAADLPTALQSLWQHSQPGEAVLLSPGCSSYDQFRDYRHRAEVFCAEISRLKASLATDQRGAVANTD